MFLNIADSPPKRTPVMPPVFAGHEDVLSMIALLGDVMRNTRRDHTGRPRHKCSPIMTGYNLNSSYWRLVVLTA